MSSDYPTLLADLTAWAERTSSHYVVPPDVLVRARAALARYGHQPAPVPAENCPACEGTPKPGNQPCAVCGRLASAPTEGEVVELVAALRADAECVEVEHYALCNMTADQMRRAADLLEQREAAPVPPAEGEVAELVVRLRRASDGASAMGWEQDSWTIARAAYLLSQRHPTPVPVSERLPGPEDCDAEGRCWWWDGEWGLIEQRFTDYLVTHWLPATALPLPAGKVE